ncbi:uncharacterized protein EHS24_001896 [Apiotrichum porosum]|uniref:Uncharacterized protein n=1 Tax=Apiotrichum porosum TaxID=105984 RepID=A0A427XJK1_9TREE|nr:uncharacterized protein EHS24_001896 [Apiotrichum porosum]RSH78972.1 hypothetical protein EHS24_001896 [Apiotrichum porosum]
MTTTNNPVNKPPPLVSPMAARVATVSAPAPPPPPATTPTPRTPVAAATNSRHTAGRPLPPPQTPDSDLYAVAAGPSTPWTAAHTARTSFFVDIDLDDDDQELSPPSFSSPGLSRCSSEPPHTMPGMQSPRQTRSRSVSRTPSLPASNDSRADLKSLPVTPQVVEQTAFLPDQLSLASSSAPTSPFQTTHIPLTAPPPPAPAAVPAGPPRTHGDSAPVTPNTLPHHLPHHHQHANSLQFAPGHAHSLSSSHVPETQHAHVLHMQYQAAALRSTQYTDLFLFEPHEYDSITDGELVRLYDRGVIDGRVLEQIVDASIRIQRACTDADRAVSIKTRRAMIRHALEE